MSIRSKLFGTAGIAIAAIGAFLLVGRAPKATDVPAIAARKPAEADPALLLVREYLRNSLDSGEWEEVRWWPVVEMTAEKNEKIKDLEQEILECEKRLRSPNLPENQEKELERELPQLRESLRITKRWPAARICRMKYRTANKYGAKEMRDFIFRIDEGKVTAFDREVQFGRDGMKQYFPE